MQTNIDRMNKQQSPTVAQVPILNILLQTIKEKNVKNNIYMYN